MNHFRTRNHSDRPLRRRLGAAAVVAVALPGLAFSASPAAASPADDLQGDLPHGLKVQATDGRSTGQCEFKVQSADFEAQTVTGRLSNQAWANGLGNRLNNVRVADRCDLFTDTGTFLVDLFREADGSRLAYGDIEVTLPMRDSYVLCTIVATVTRSGERTVSPQECTD